MTLTMEQTINFAIEEALEKFGRYNTPDLFNRVVEVANRNPNIDIGTLTDEVALCFIINSDIYAAPRTHGFLHLSDISRQVFDESLELEEPLTETNSICWVRDNQITRERIGVWKKTAAHFVEWMREKNTWVEEYFGADAIKHFHPYVQVRMLDDATYKAANAVVDPPVLGCTTAAIELKSALELYIPKEFFPEEFSEDDIDAIKQAVLNFFAKKQSE